jgi:drug/metabolite transporter (DMT)-like permease
LPSLTRTARANAMLVLAAILWGLAFTAQRLGAERMGAYTFSCVRFAMGGLLLVVIIVIMDAVRHTPSAERRSATRAVLLPSVPIGIALALAVNLQQVAMVTVTASNAAFITGLYLIFVPLLGLLFGRRLRWPMIIAVVLAVAGLYLIAVVDTLSLQSGDVLMLGCAMTFAIEILLIDHFAPRLDPLRFASAQFLWCALFSGIMALWRESAPFTGLTAAIWPLLYGGFISVGIAYTLQVIAQRDAQPTPAALIMGLEAVFGAIGGVVLLHETLPWRGWLGAAMMLAGSVIAQFAARTTPDTGDTAMPQTADAQT